jgi:GNAT superfamily N-acetyltransferase
MNFEFRKATVIDIPKLVELRQKQLTDEKTTAPFNISKELFDYFNSAIEDKSFFAWVAVLNEKIIATCGMSFGRKPPYFQNTSGMIGEVCNVFTEKEFRRQGLAKNLLQRIIDEAKERGVISIRVSASEVGKFLYKNFGFSKAENFYIFNN